MSTTRPADRPARATESLEPQVLTRMARRRLQVAFSAWMMADRDVDTVAVSGSPDPWPVASLVYDLWEDVEGLDPAVQVKYGLPPDATYAHAARILWCIWAENEGLDASLRDAARTFAVLSGDALRSQYEVVDHRLGRANPPVRAVG